MSKRVTFLEEDLKAMLTPMMEGAGFLHDGQEIVGFEYRTRTIKKDGDYKKDVVPPEARDLFEESELETIHKIIVLVK